MSGKCLSKITDTRSIEVVDFGSCINGVNELNAFLRRTSNLKTLKLSASGESDSLFPLLATNCKQLERFVLSSHQQLRDTEMWLCRIAKCKFLYKSSFLVVFSHLR
jgi:hypothetical protein